jgi:fumarate reductase flavoprotein subunit
VRGRPLPRLHAAGEVVGGFHGAGYMSGSSLGKAVIFGLVAGHAAAMS